MPQMAPINWLLILLFTFLMIALLNSLLYYNVQYNSCLPKCISMKKIYWKW